MLDYIIEAVTLSRVLQIVLGIVGLSLLVFVHEFGHFAAAKWCGVRVLTFSIGFGKKLLKFTHNGTTYCISAILFGGYCAMAGENPAHEREDKPDDFNVQPIWKRALIAFAGPALNIIFAYVLLTGMYMVGSPEPVSDKLVVGIVEKESAGAEAGIVPGDTILSIDGAAVDGWDKFREEMGISIGRALTLEVSGAGGRRFAQVTPRELGELGIGSSGIHPRHRIFAAGVNADSPAGRAGLAAGDSILYANGHLIAHYMDLINITSNSGGSDVELVYLRRNKAAGGVDTLKSNIAPKWDDAEKRYLLGIQMGILQFDEMVVVHRALGASMLLAAQKSWDMGTKIFRFIGRIINGQIKIKAMSGPVGIVQVIGLVWLENLQKAVWLMALISINLGVMNLLPLAITDGGILLFLLIEKLRGKPLSQKHQLRIQNAAALFFIMFFMYITFIDLSRGGMMMR